jgi:hypothetical protein
MTKIIEVTTPFKNRLVFHESIEWKDPRNLRENTIRTFVEALRHNISQSKAYFEVANRIYESGYAVDWSKLRKCWHLALTEWNARRNGCIEKQSPALSQVPNGHNRQNTAGAKVNANATTTGLAAKAFVIDGKNVICGSPSHPCPSLMNLLALQMELQKRKCTVKSFFDANTFFTLIKAGKNGEAYAYRRFCHDFPDVFIEVPGGSQADDYILDYANSQGMTIISNDLYREFENKYKWLHWNSNRRISFVVHSGMFQVVPLKIQAAIPKDLAVAEAALRTALGMPVSVNNLDKSERIMVTA